MRILNPDVHDTLQSGQPLKLNLGCGRRKVDGYFGVDVVELPEVDIVANLNEPFDMLPDDSVDAIQCRHTLEHIERFMDLMVELHRVCRPGATIEIVVPHFSNPYGYSDPTHVRFFGLYSFHYFCDAADQPARKVPNFYSEARFRVESVGFHLLTESLLDKLVAAVFQPLLKRGIGALDWYERRMCRLFPVSTVRYSLTPVKSPRGISVGRRNKTWQVDGFERAFTEDEEACRAFEER